MSDTVPPNDPLSRLTSTEAPDSSYVSSSSLTQNSKLKIKSVFNHTMTDTSSALPALPYFTPPMRALSALTITLFALISLQNAHAQQVPLSPQPSERACPQFAALNTGKKHAHLSAVLEELYASEVFKEKAVSALGGAIRIPTESYDGMGKVGEDPRYEIFGDLHTFLRDTFPLVFQKLNVTTVNTYNLVMHWQGLDGSLLPVLMTGHQDVVPVDLATWNQWLHPPYSGHFDGTWIWGRGTCDDKSPVIAILLSIEALLQHGFRPTRTFVFAFGIDEEASGNEGAGEIAKYLESTYGRGSFAAILDEGNGYSAIFGENLLFVMPSTSEKGYLDVTLEVTTPGGHSSVPPVHTSIGILSALITTVESHPLPPTLLREGTPFATIQCTTAYAHNVPQALRDLAQTALTDDDALRKLGSEVAGGVLGGAYGAMVRTTQAVDLVQGGVKVNALPEKASATVNYRIAEHSSVDDVQRHLIRLLAPMAAQYNLTFSPFASRASVSAFSSSGHLTLSDPYASALQPSPPTPVGPDARPWRLLVGTIKASLNASRRTRGKEVIVSPMLSVVKVLTISLNKDTRSYWNLTRHIFRYTHMDDDTDAYNGLHTVNEAIRAEAYFDNIAFLTKFMLNWDEASF
ncbi:hypothetical protein BXZ70DRAFT_1010387 [Cristinia sonorae]|uniref:Peptidase M20 dimerisation domain-containing protein n=1 Tax=Cristinia sonorae TaxID=1940300 RepID=A0A8K0UIT2_9AGAR|nr:hypothetical protein BXZ70DRAFT_1010387 [Cristinia sonorae]